MLKQLQAYYIIPLDLTRLQNTRETFETFLPSSFLYSSAQQTYSPKITATGAR